MNKLLFIVLLNIVFYGYSNAQTTKNKSNTMTKELKVATLANGCFWCTEAIFQRLNGVEEVTSGFTGGHIKNPAYREVVSGRTGHAEALQIKFNPDIISFQELLDVFFSTHDPTTLNRQGYDIGTQYRSAIFYHSKEQKEQSKIFIKELKKAEVFDDPIVTEVTKFDVFYTAEDYHQNYYNNNKNQRYCVAVINPKLEKFLKKYKNKLKSNSQ